MWNCHWQQRLNLEECLYRWDFWQERAESICPLPAIAIHDPNLFSGCQFRSRYPIPYKKNVECAPFLRYRYNYIISQTIPWIEQHQDTHLISWYWYYVLAWPTSGCWRAGSVSINKKYIAKNLIELKLSALTVFPLLEAHKRLRSILPIRVRDATQVYVHCI